MLVENQLVETIWSPATTELYKSKGYNYTGRWTKLFVDIKDLPHGSHAKVRVICDFCGKEYTKTYKDYFRQHEGGDCCVECEGKKSFLSVEQKYGENSRIKKLKEGILNKYGTENIQALPETREKIKQTNMEKYGVVSVLCLEEYRKNGTELSWTEDARAKRVNTNVERYGSASPLSSAEIREKITASYYKNGSTPTSEPQRKLCEQLKQIYSNCELNYPCGKYSLDCFIEVNGVKIDVEYDGAYWHQDKEKDEKRNVSVIANGYKVFRIISDSKLPTDKELTEEINQLINSKENIRILNLKE